MSRLIFIFFICFIVNAQNNNAFYLKREYPMSDLNYFGIENIDEYQFESLVDSVFNVKPGIYSVRIYERISKSDTKSQDNLKENIELIIVKIIDNQIIETYYCPLNWREPPISRVLLHSKEKIKLSNKIPLKKIKMRNVYKDGFEIKLKGYLIN